MISPQNMGAYDHFTLHFGTDLAFSGTLKETIRTRRTHADSCELGRKPLGSRPLSRAVDIVSKPRIWCRNAWAISLKNQLIARITRPGRVER